MRQQTIHVILVEDSDAAAYGLQAVLAEESRSGPQAYEIRRAATLADGLELLAASEPQVILLDLSLPDSRGLETVRRMRAAAPDLPIVVLTAQDDDALSIAALREGASDYLIKGLDTGRQVSRAIRYAVERQEIHRRQQELIQRLQTALAEVRTLGGLLPICAWCKKIRNDRGYWLQLEQYLDEHSDAQVTHGLCPDCAEKMEAQLEQGGGI